MKLWHEVAGDGSPVLLIHEGICDSRMWESQWQTFPRVHRTVRCDLRGFGQTPLPTEPYSNARDVVELLDRLELGAAALVGVSLGGRVALEVGVGPAGPGRAARPRGARPPGPRLVRHRAELERGGGRRGRPGRSRRCRGSEPAHVGRRAEPPPGRG